MNWSSELAAAAGTNRFPFTFLGHTAHTKFRYRYKSKKKLNHDNYQGWIDNKQYSTIKKSDYKPKEVMLLYNYLKKYSIENEE